MKKKVLCAVVCAMTFSANADVVDDVMVNDVVEGSAFDSVFVGFGFGVFRHREQRRFAASCRD